MMKRYHRLTSGLDNENRLRRRNAENSKSKSTSLPQDLQVGNYMYVRSHKKRVQIGCNGKQVEHMVTVDASTRPLWKKVASQRYVCREARSLCDFRDKSGLLGEQANSLPCATKPNALEINNKHKEQLFFEIPRYTGYKRISFPTCGNVERKNDSLLASVAPLPRLTSMHSLNASRERARKERVSSLKTCKNRVHRYSGVQEQLVAKRSQARSQYQEQDAQPISQKEIAVKAKSIWKSFNSAFMRHGSKLRYQTVLRKALPTL